MDGVTPEDQTILDALRHAVAETLDRKQRLGQYAVVWRDGRPVLIGEELPQSPMTEDLRFVSALMCYKNNRLSLGKAAELAGYSKLDFIERMKLENEPIFDYSEAEIAEIFVDVDKLP